MSLGGYANRVAHVDLSTGQVAYKPIPEEWARKYIGARGLGVRYVLENGPTVEPLAPENMLKSSGRGIFFMRSFMDDVRLQRAPEGGMEVRMMKKLSAGG